MTFHTLMMYGYPARVLIEVDHPLGPIRIPMSHNDNKVGDTPVLTIPLNEHNCKKVARAIDQISLFKGPE